VNSNGKLQAIQALVKITDGQSEELASRRKGEFADILLQRATALFA
jgi:hypothetical protein